MKLFPTRLMMKSQIRHFCLISSHPEQLQMAGIQSWLVWQHRSWLYNQNLTSDLSAVQAPARFKPSSTASEIKNTTAGQPEDSRLILSKKNMFQQQPFKNSPLACRQERDQNSVVNLHAYESQEGSLSISSANWK